MIKKNKDKINEEICPHCGSGKKREMQGGVFPITAPVTVCSNCKKEIKDFWWCENCGEMVDPEQVTYDEKHDIKFGGCGMPVT